MAETNCAEDIRVQKHNYQGFKQAVEQYAISKGQNPLNLAVEIQAVPDPDALASSYGLVKLLESMGHSATVSHARRLSHPQNIVMKKSTNMKTMCYAQTDLNPDTYDGILFADHSGGTSQWNIDGKIKSENLVAIIDHHDLEKPTPEGVYSDRRQIGAASSIIAEYVLDAMEKSELPDVDQKLCTALYFGICNDTNDLKRNATQFDRDMINKLQSKIDESLLDEIENIRWPIEWQRIYGKAISECITHNELLVASVGRLPEESYRDIIPMVADQALNTKGIDTVYVFGFNDNKVDVSVRTRDKTFDYSDMMKLFPEGRGGGKEGSGGMQIPLNLEESFLKTSDDPEKLNEIILEKFKSKLFRE